MSAAHTNDVHIQPTPISLSSHLGNCRKGREGEPYESFVLRVHEIEQQSSSTEPRSVDKQVSFEHDEPPDSDFRHDTDCSANELLERPCWRVPQNYCS